MFANPANVHAWRSRHNSSHINRLTAGHYVDLI